MLLPLVLVLNFRRTTLALLKAQKNLYIFISIMVFALSLVGCCGIKPHTAPLPDDTKKGPGLLTGPKGYYEIDF